MNQRTFFFPKGKPFFSKGIFSRKICFNKLFSWKSKSWSKHLKWKLFTLQWLEFILQEFVQKCFQSLIYPKWTFIPWCFWYEIPEIFTSAKCINISTPFPSFNRTLFPCFSKMKMCFLINHMPDYRRPSKSEQRLGWCHGNGKCSGCWGESDCQGCELLCLSLPFPFKLLPRRGSWQRAKAANKSKWLRADQQFLLATANSGSSALPCFPACPRTVSRLWGHKSNPQAPSHFPAASMYEAVLPVPPIVTLPSRN